MAHGCQLALLKTWEHHSDDLLGTMTMHTASVLASINQIMRMLFQCYFLSLYFAFYQLTYTCINFSDTMDFVSGSVTCDQHACDNGSKVRKTRAKKKETKMGVAAEAVSYG